MKSLIARFTSLLPVTAALALSLLTSPGAHAQGTYSYQPTPKDMNDFDHHSLYTWSLNTPGVDTTAVSVTGASLTFTNIANWEKASNAMHLWMFDTSVYGGVKEFADDKSSNSNVSDLTDDFSNGRYHNGKDANGKMPRGLSEAAPGKHASEFQRRHGFVRLQMELQCLYDRLAAWLRLQQLGRRDDRENRDLHVQFDRPCRA